MNQAMLRTENWSNPTFSSTVLDVVYELGWALISLILQHPVCKYTIQDIFAIYTRSNRKIGTKGYKIKDI